MRQLILQCRLISAGICVYTLYIYIVSYAQECNYRLRLTHVQWYNDVRLQDQSQGAQL